MENVKIYKTLTIAFNFIDLKLKGYINSCHKLLIFHKNFLSKSDVNIFCGYFHLTQREDVILVRISPERSTEIANA